MNQEPRNPGKETKIFVLGFLVSRFHSEMRSILLATRNAHKTREFAEILGNEFEVTDLCDRPEIILPEETGRSFAENAVQKAIAASRVQDLLVVADDSGLEVDALNGEPGIFSARYASPKATDEENVRRLLSELGKRKVPGTEISARFRCVIALAREGKLLSTFEGTVEGSIVDLPRGRNGFGYDPIFVAVGFEQTFAELPPETKNQISHRAKAIQALREALRKTNEN